MNILMISRDRSLLQEDSAARQRMIEYGNLVDDLRVIIFNTKKDISTPINDRRYVLISDNVYVYPTNSRSKWFYILDAYKIGKKIIENFLDNLLITSQDPFECGIAGWFLKKKFSVPLQLQIHTDFLSPYFWKESILNKTRVLIAKFLIPRADCVRVVSKRIRRSLLEELAVGEREKVRPQIIILPIFVDIKRIKEEPIKIDLHKNYPQFDFIILMASRLTKEKNIVLAIRAMAEIVKKYPKTGLIIVGSGSEEYNLRYQIINLKMKENIIIEDWTNNIVSYYKTADLFLLTSNYEGYGMSVVEAMAVGCPVIMTDVGLAGEVLINKKDGIVVPVGNKEELTEAIIGLMEKSDVRKKLVENADKTLTFWLSKEGYLRQYRDPWLLCRKKNF